MMLTIRQQYLIDEKGRKTAVVLSRKEYRALVERLEELEDALALERAVELATGLRAYGEIRAESRKEGML